MEINQEIQKKINIVEDAKKKSYTFGIVTLIVVLVLILGAIQPTFVTITRILSEIEVKKATSQQLQLKIDALNSLARDFTTNTKALDDLKFYFPNRGDFSLIMANISEIANNNQFDLKNIGFDSADSNTLATAGSYSVLQPWKASISVTGSKDNLVNFLKDLEALPNYPVMDSISFANSADQEGNMTFSMTLRIFKIDDQDFYKAEATQLTITENQ